MAANSEKIINLMQKINESVNNSDTSESEKLECEWKNAISAEFQIIAKEIKSLAGKVEKINTLKDYLKSAENNSKQQILEFKLKLENFKIDTAKSLIERIENRVEDLLANVVIKLLNEKFPEIQSSVQKIKNFENFTEKIKEKFNEIDLRLDDDESILSEQRRQIQGDLEEAIAKNEENIKRNNELIIKFQEHLKKLEDSNLNATRICQTSIHKSIQKFDLRIPKFKGDSYVRPVKFLNELKRYVHITKPAKSEIKYVLAQAFEGSAKNWFEIYEAEITSFEDFENKFYLQYWNENHQRNARKKLEFGQYFPNGKYSRSEYALDLLSIASELKDSREESEIINQISMHFEKDVRVAIRSLGTKNKQNLLLTLSDFDNDDIQNRSRERNLSKSEGNSHRQNQNFSQNTSQANVHEDKFDEKRSRNSSSQYKGERFFPSQRSENKEVCSIKVVNQQMDKINESSGGYKKHIQPENFHTLEELYAQKLGWPKNV